MAALIETPCGVTILHTGIRLLTGTTGAFCPVGHRWPVPEGFLAPFTRIPKGAAHADHR